MTAAAAVRTWPAIEKPVGRNYWWWAAWLLGQHGQLAALARRALVVSVDDDGDLDVDLDGLAEAFRIYDEVSAGWDDRWECWEDVTPPVPASVVAIAPMSGSEKGRLRLLAVLAPGQRVPLHYSDVTSFDDNGVRLLSDWCFALSNL